LALAGWTSTGASAATLALRVDSAGSSPTGTAFTAGWSFTVGPTSISVLALDYYSAPAATGVANVRLYTAGGTVLASASVVSSDPTIGNASYLFNSHAISAVSLSANTTYYIAADIPVGQSYASHATVTQVAPEITYVGGLTSLGLGGKPTSDLFNLLPQSYFGPSFEFVANTGGPNAVPLPSSTVMGLGLLCSLGALGFYMKKVRGSLRMNAI
jgi:hypothetical protein